MTIGRRWSSELEYRGSSQGDTAGFTFILRLFKVSVFELPDAVGDDGMINHVSRVLVLRAFLVQAGYLQESYSVLVPNIMCCTYRVAHSVAQVHTSISETDTSKGSREASS